MSPCQSVLRIFSRPCWNQTIQTTPAWPENHTARRVQGLLCSVSCKPEDRDHSHCACAHGAPRARSQNVELNVPKTCLTSWSIIKQMTEFAQASSIRQYELPSTPPGAANATPRATADSETLTFVLNLPRRSLYWPWFVT